MTTATTDDSSQERRQHEGTCKACGALIVWALTKRSKWIPVDPRTIDLRTRPRIVMHLGRRTLCFDRTQGHRPHFDHCKPHETETT